MARTKKEVYSEEEVELIIQILLTGMLSGVTQMLLGAKAEPSAEIGKVIMHLSNGALENDTLARETVKSLQLSEARLAQLQELANGKLK